MPNLTQVLRGKRPSSVIKKTNFTDKPSPRYKIMTELALKNSIVDKRIYPKSDDKCVSQINQMLICLKEKDYNQAQCQTEINAYNSCINTLIKNNRDHQAAMNDLTSAKANQSPKVINSLLKKYPQPKKKVEFK